MVKMGNSCDFGGPYSFFGLFSGFAGFKGVFPKEPRNLPFFSQFFWDAFWAGLCAEAQKKAERAHKKAGSCGPGGVWHLVNQDSKNT